MLSQSYQIYVFHYPWLHVHKKNLILFSVGLVWYSHLRMKEERRERRKLISLFRNICKKPQLEIATNSNYHLSQDLFFILLQQYHISLAMILTTEGQYVMERQVSCTKIYQK